MAIAIIAGVFFAVAAGCATAHPKIINQDPTHADVRKAVRTDLPYTHNSMEFFNLSHTSTSAASQLPSPNPTTMLQVPADQR